jgi:hypothetical protein
MFGKPAHALFADIGSGKTVMLLAEALIAWQAGIIDGALIVSWNGVHRKWITEQLPKVTGVECHGSASPDAPLLKPTVGPRFYAIHREGIAMKGKTWRRAAKAFLKSGRMAFIWDESQDIRTPNAKRTKIARWLAPYAVYRRIASGFPNPTGMHNLYSQYTFLDPDILDMRTFGRFKDRYMVFESGYKGHPQLAGYKNEDDFHRRVAPYTTHMEQDRRGRAMPLRVVREIELTREQRRLWTSLKKEFTMVFESGRQLDVPLAITRLMRLQQLTCGWVPVDEDTWEYVDENRTTALMEVLEECRGKVVIWSRFTHCIERLQARLGKRALSIYGKVKHADRERALVRFEQESAVRWLICQPETVGTGRNELVVASKAVYWSNDFKALTRRQSEGRIDRDGQVYRPTFIDIVARDSYDQHVLDVLQQRIDVGQSIMRDMDAWR